MNYPKNVTHDVAFCDDNTEGYSQSELDQLNIELSEQLEGIEIGSDNYYQTAKQFADEMARR